MVAEVTDARGRARGGPGEVPVLRLTSLSKAFGGAQALSDVSLEIGRDEVHGLLGHNGSGKSTLIKVLAGVYEPDQGDLEINGQDVRLPLAPGQFRDLGLSFVHQDLGLIADLTVLENLLAAETLVRPGYERISHRALRSRAQDLLGEFDIRVSPEAEVSEISATDRARIAIVRAVEEIRTSGEEGRHGVLVLDEPTVFLPREGVEELFALIRRVVRHHASVLFVSHDLDEVKEITDRATVLVDGRTRATVAMDEVTAQDLVRLIVGQELPEAHQPRSEGGADAGRRAVRIRGLRTATIDDVSLDVADGEIVGVTGLPGSGYDELLYTVFGAGSASAGSMVQGDREWDLTRIRPAQAVEAGIGLVPADRPHLGGVQELMLYENVMLPVLSSFRGRLGSLSHQALKRRTRALLKEFGVRSQGPDQPLGSLSGGNQQKVILAKWLELRPRLLLLHEPTQGVDVGARHDIEELLLDLAARGLPIICAGSDGEELAGLCHRVVVFRRGRIAAELRGASLSKESLLQQIYGAAG